MAQLLTKISLYCEAKGMSDVDFKKEAPGKGEADTYLKDIEYPSKSGSEHVQPSLFNMANEKDY